MPDSLVVDTVNTIITVHDTVMIAVHDTVVRVAEPQPFGELMSVAARIATIVAAGVAIWGIGAWWHQLRRTTDYRLAMRMYRAALRLRDRIDATRNELNHMIMIPKEEANDERAVLTRQYKKYEEWFREVIRAALALKDLRPEVEILWGFEGTQHIDALDEMARRLRGGHQAFFSHAFKGVDGDVSMRVLAEKQRNLAFAPLPDEPDEYGDELAKRVEAARAFLQPKVGRRRHGVN